MRIIFFVAESSKVTTKPVSFVDEIRQAAENIQNENGFVYEPTSGLYYDRITGYYYNAVGPSSLGSISDIESPKNHGFKNSEKKARRFEHLKFQNSEVSVIRFRRYFPDIVIPMCISM